MASTWTTERLKQLVAWNGKVTAGSYAVVISEASLRSTEKLPSEGATGHDAGKSSALCLRVQWLWLRT